MSKASQNLQFYESSEEDEQQESKIRELIEAEEEMLKDPTSFQDPDAFRLLDDRGRKRMKSGDDPESIEILGERDRKSGAPRKKREAREEEVREPRRLVDPPQVSEKSQQKSGEQAENSSGKQEAVGEDAEAALKNQIEEVKEKEEEHVVMTVERELTEEEKARERVR